MDLLEALLDRIHSAEEGQDQSQGQGQGGGAGGGPSSHLNVTTRSNGYSALHHAVDMGAARTLARLLAEEGVDREAKDKQGRTALDFAREQGNPAVTACFEA